MVEPEPTPKNPRKAQIQMDEKLAQRLFEEEQARFEREQRIARERAAEQEAKDVALIEQMEDNSAQKPDDYLSETHGQVHLQSAEEQDGKKDDSSSKQEESSMKRPRSEHDEERDDIAIDVESLATKYPIVDWKTHILTENMMYYQIIRADGSSKNYKIFSEMLDDFDRQDVMDLHRLVKGKEDEVWRNQQGYNLISWRLFDSCGVHVLLMDNGIAIHIMIEKKYPLTQEMLSRMLNRRLEVDHESEMAFEILRFTRSQLKK
ncbi:hypothetical protein Tco_0874706 [Tanacetum coccineum]|uniref:Uncharacterized protein n=1 Tax=Tanacetum coccineum TaxID=301880 RepID=A0ABQ5BMD2_9ASTR